MKYFMKFKILFCVLALIGLIALMGCSFQPQKKNSYSDAVEECIMLCKIKLHFGHDLSNGPCLSNDLKKDGEWVCDVAHSPRKPVDNLPENQCPAYREGIAKHFVEVSPECEFIKQY